MKNFLILGTLFIGCGFLFGCAHHAHSPHHESYDLISPVPIFADEEVIIIQDPYYSGEHWDYHKHHKRRRRHH